VRARERVDAFSSGGSEYEDVGATLDGRVTVIVNSGIRFGRIIIVSPGGKHRVVVEPSNVHSEASGKDRERTYVAFLPVHGAVDAGEAHFGNGKYGRAGSARHEVSDVGGTTGVTVIESHDTDGSRYVVEEPNFFE